MHNIHEGSIFKRLRIRLFGPTERERSENMQEFRRIEREVRQQQAIEDAADELTIIRGWSPNYVRRLRTELEPLPGAVRAARLRELFNEDAWRIAPLFDVSALDLAAGCDLCSGDGWIPDTIDYWNSCTATEQRRLARRMERSRIDRVGCPRCQGEPHG